MARIPPIDLQNTHIDNEKVKKLLTNAAADGHGGIFNHMGHAQGIVRQFSQFSSGFLTRLELSHHQREIVIVRTAALSQCPYEITQHKPIALSKNIGWTEPQLIEVMTGKMRDNSIWTDADKQLLLFVDQVFTTTNVDDETFKATKPYFSERELVEITMMVGMYRMLAGFLNTFAIPMEEVTDNFIEFTTRPKL